MSLGNLIEMPVGTLSKDSVELRQRTRRLVAAEKDNYSAVFRSNSWCALAPEFSRKMGDAGLLGLTLPCEYGGGGLTNLERYVVVEEVLFAGAPAGFHWVADRQSGLLISRHGTREQKEQLLPGICRGELCFCIGLSEPDAGSDLASLRANARKVDGGWILNGTKVWTTSAQVADYMIGLFRTDLEPASRHAGMSQFIIDMKNTKGLEVSPIRDLAGHEHFNEVSFVDAFIPESALLGSENNGWNQVLEELSLERCGPERFMSCMVLYTDLIDLVRGQPEAFDLGQVRRIVGDLVANLATLRSMSISATTMLTEGKNVSLQASMVKDIGAEYEQTLPTTVQQILDSSSAKGPSRDSLWKVLANLTMIAPSFSLRGGTIEILRGIIAKELSKA